MSDELDVDICLNFSTFHYGQMEQVNDPSYPSTTKG